MLITLNFHVKTLNLLPYYECKVILSIVINVINFQKKILKIKTKTELTQIIKKKQLVFCFNN